CIILGFFSMILICSTNVNAEEIDGTVAEPNQETIISNANTVSPGVNEGIINSTWGTSPVEFNKSDGRLIVKKGIISTYTYITSYVDEDQKINKSDVKSVVFEDGVQAHGFGGVLFAAINNWIKLESITGSLDTSGINDMHSMFFNPTLSNIELNNFNTSNVTNMSNMFAGSRVSELNLKDFETSNVTDMTAMFQNMPNLSNLDVSNFDTSSVTKMSMMFDTIPNLQTLNLDNFDTSKVRDMSYMFRRDYGISNLILNTFDTSNVFNMTSMFEMMSNLEVLDISSFDVSNTGQMYSIFYQDYKLKNITLGEKFKFKSVSSLPEIDQNNGNYTGRWIKNNPIKPLSIYNSSALFEENYDGKLPGTYEWELSNMKSTGAIITRYVDEDGNDISEPLIYDPLGSVGDPYETQPIEIEHWKLKEIPDNAKGQLTEKEQVVTYVYEREDGAAVTVKYVDEKENELSKAMILQGKYGTEYESQPATIKGWKLKQTPTNASGTFTEEEQTVTYVYEQKDGASVTVKYVDEKGNELSKTVILQGKYGTKYESQPATIKGWKLKQTSTNASGIFTEEEQTVTYVYVKEKKATPTTSTAPSSASKETAKDSVKLPQTGENTTFNTSLMMLGVLILGLSGLLTYKYKLK
ncbi:MucBP domain-containing protein, partial [Enterococcus faecalis]|nr:MucBP domain-containing protein [Enterococcus faecalis]